MIISFFKQRDFREHRLLMNAFGIDLPGKDEGPLDSKTKLGPQNEGRDVADKNKQKDENPENREKKERAEDLNKDAEMRVAKLLERAQQASGSAKKTVDGVSGEKEASRAKAALESHKATNEVADLFSTKKTELIGGDNPSLYMKKEGTQVVQGKAPEKNNQDQVDKPNLDSQRKTGAQA